MPKRKYNKKGVSKKDQLTTISSNDRYDDENNISISTIDSSNQCEADILDKTEQVMKKRKKHLQDFQRNMKRNKVDSNSDDAPTDESTEDINHEIPNNDSSTSKDLAGIDKSCLNTAVECASSSVSQPVSSFRPPLTLTSNHTEQHVELNKSILLHKKNQGDQISHAKRSIDMIDNDNCNRSVSSVNHSNESAHKRSQRIQSTSTSIENSFDNSSISKQNGTLSQTASNTKKVPYVSKSTITFTTQTVNNQQVNSSLSQSTKSSNINRSLICMSATTDKSTLNQSSTKNNLQWRPVDVKNATEYKEVEKKNKDLMNKIENLKAALVKERKEKKKMEETHMIKPRENFWNELFLFIESNENRYQNDNRTIEEVASDLGLNGQTTEFVQRDAIRPDKVAMNVWRHLRPTVDDKVYVHSIKQVPMSTLKNIHAFARLSRPKYSFSYKKMRSDIAANIRQGNRSDRTRRSMLDQNVPQRDVDNAGECDESNEDDESDEDDDEELNEDENFDNVRADTRKRKTIEESSAEEE